MEDHFNGAIGNCSVDKLLSAPNVSLKCPKEAYIGR